jgi:anti-sigma-K factor RskA
MAANSTRSALRKVLQVRLSPSRVFSVRPDPFSCCELSPSVVNSVCTRYRAFLVRYLARTTTVTTVTAVAAAAAAAMVTEAAMALGLRVAPKTERKGRPLVYDGSSAPSSSAPIRATNPAASRTSLSSVAASTRIDDQDL